MFTTEKALNHKVLTSNNFLLVKSQKLPNIVSFHSWPKVTMDRWLTYSPKRFIPNRKRLLTRNKEFTDLKTCPMNKIKIDLSLMNPYLFLTS
jgi:hypothetical protein